MKKNIIYGLLFTLIITMIFATTSVPENKPTYAEEQNVQYVTIMGVGEVETAPDVAEINIGIQKLADSISNSQTKMNETIETITNKIKEIDADATLTVNYSSCYPVSNNGVPNYESNCNISIKTKQLDKVNSIIESCSNAGATSFCNIHYTLEDEKNLYNQALVKAKENSYSKATVLYDNVTLKDMCEVSISTFRNNSMENTIVVTAFVKARYVINNETNSTTDNETQNDTTDNSLDSSKDDINDSQLIIDDKNSQNQDDNIITNETKPEVKKSSKNTRVNEKEMAEKTQNDKKFNKTSYSAI